MKPLKSYYATSTTSGTHPELLSAYLTGTGMTEIYQGYLHEYPRQRVSLVHACTAGVWDVLVDGDWVTVGAGTAYVTPMNATAGIRSHGADRARLYWARWSREAPELPVISGNSYTTTGKADGLAWAYEGLYEELLGGGRPELLCRLAAVVEFYARDLVNPGPYRHRLAALWREVEQSLEHSWTIGNLARKAGMSQESLRLVCHQEVGRSPMKQVAHLRIQRACHLLASYSHPIKQIASLVGYSDIYSFSRWFKHMTGKSPTRVRDESRRGPEGAGDV